MDEKTEKILNENHPDRAAVARALFDSCKKENAELGFELPDEILAAICRLEAKRISR